MDTKLQAQHVHRAATISGRPRCQHRTATPRVAAVKHNEGQERAESTSQASKREDTSFFAARAAEVSNLVNTLLFGAASRIERGTSVCVSCRGSGSINCKDCRATGILDTSASRKGSSGRKGFIGTKSKEKEWIVSNRCKKCRGHGRLECSQCNGLGKRFVDSSVDWD